MSQGTEPSLSVIVPTYNRSGYVRQCVRALRACGVPDLEIIVADDGSTDDTEQVLTQTDPAARYFRQANTGTPATARNRGFEMSRGRYVAFLDCDDEWLPDTPARAVELLDHYPAVEVLFAEARMGNPSEGYRSWIEMGGQAAFFELPCTRPEPNFRVLERGPFFQRMAVRNPVFIGAVVMRREAFVRSGGFAPELRGAADWELWLRMASRMTFGYLDRPLAVYTRHLDNMSSDYDGMSREFCLALQKVREKCAWLTPDERAWIGQRLRHLLFGHGYRAYDRGDYGAARARFAELLRRCGPELRGLAYWTLCSLPFGLASGLRRLKHALSRRPAPAPARPVEEAP
jgi:glycosyltransferase involved in cell wall biosynthesis